MASKVKITLLVENTTYRRNLYAEHGLSYYIEINNKRYLFDTGQTGIIVKNSETLGIPLDNLDGVILSHGHYDHTGGLMSVINGKVNIYAHPDIFTRRYSFYKPDNIHEIGIPYSKDELEKRGAVFHLTKDSFSLGDITVTGEVPRETSYEKIPDNFYKDKNLTTHDKIMDDLSTFIETKKGIVVLLGCCHAGIVNTLNHISRLTGKNEFYWIIGGTHLIGSDKDRIEKTISDLKKFKFNHISPLHCTGPIAKNELMNAFRDEFYNLATGNSIVI